MLAVLDPLLFGGPRPIGKTELDEVARILRQTAARIPAVPFYWNKLQRELVQPLSRQGGSRDLRIGLDAIRSSAASIRFPAAPPRVALWDFCALFMPAGPEWVDVMTRTLTGCALTGEETILITQLLSGRNAKKHSGPDQCRLTEKTCWNLRIRLPNMNLRRIPAVCSRRNVSIPWTTRFDDRLPAESDGAAFPFCPRPDWFKSTVGAFETHQGRPAWLDAKGNHWACPAAGWGHHWDVYLDPHLADRYGLGQLNIVRWGASPGEGVVGGLHHIRRETRPRLKTRTGWTC